MRQERSVLTDVRVSRCEGCISTSAARETIKVVLRGEEFLAKRKLPGQRVGAKAWFDFFTEYLTEELNYQFSAECPCLGRNEKSIIFDSCG